MLTTGQIAKECNVTIRTVQFYDRMGLLKPSSLSDGGRRLYTEDELVKLKLICLYKSLGFSLDDIKIALCNANYIEIRNIMKEKRVELEAQIKKLETTKQNLIAIDDLIMNDHLDVKSIEHLNALLRKKSSFKKHTNITYFLLISYFVALLLIVFLARPIEGIKPYILVVVVFLLLSGFVYYHCVNNAYVCPNCHQKFELSFLKDLFTLHDNKKGKKTKCPYCNHKGWFKETFRD